VTESVLFCASYNELLELELELKLDSSIPL
jgi:hypothetical protein